MLPAVRRQNKSSNAVMHHLDIPPRAQVVACDREGKEGVEEEQRVVREKEGGCSLETEPI
jgi:hypothetical protein